MNIAEPPSIDDLTPPKAMAARDCDKAAPRVDLHRSTQLVARDRS